jgi:hypothetical protein
MGSRSSKIPPFDLDTATLVRAGTVHDVLRMVRLGARIVGRDAYEDVDGACHPCVQVHWGRQRVVVVLHHQRRGREVALVAQRPSLVYGSSLSTIPP